MENKGVLRKKLLKTTIASTFALTAALPMFSSNADAAAKFKDVPAGAFYEEAVGTLSERGIIGGYSDGTFQPNKSVTRAEAAKMIAYDLGVNEVILKTEKFTDVKTGDWFYQPVTALSIAGGISGYENGTFLPNKTVTRAEIASMLVKAYALKDNTTAAKAPFTDVAPDSWYAAAVQTLYGNKITSGKSATQFAPDAPVTRGEIAAFIQKVNEAKADKDTTPATTDKENKDENKNNENKADDKKSTTPSTPSTPAGGGGGGGGGGGTTTPTTPTTPSSPTDAAIDSILEKYVDDLDSIKEDADNKLDEILESENYLALPNLYKDTKAAFTSQYDEIEQELKAAGLTADQAKEKVKAKYTQLARWKDEVHSKLSSAGFPDELLDQYF